MKVVWWESPVECWFESNKGIFDNTHSSIEQPSSCRVQHYECVKKLTAVSLWFVSDKVEDVHCCRESKPINGQDITGYLK